MENERNKDKGKSPDAKQGRTQEYHGRYQKK